MIPLNEIADLWAAAMLRASIQGGIALALVLGLCVVFKRMPPRVRCLLWRLAYAKLFVSLFWAGAVVLPVLAPAAPPGTDVSTTPFAGTEPSVVATTAIGESPVRVVRQRKPLPSVPAIFLMFWCLIVLLHLARLGRQWQATSRRRASLRFADQRELLALYQKLCADIGLPDAPPLKVGPAIESPQLLGIVQPTIALPEGLYENLSRREIEMVLAHELAHFQRHDLVWALLPALAQAVFFFHPLLWWTHREWRLAQEIACDERAILGTRSSGSTGSTYSAVLVRVAGGLDSPTRPDFNVATLAESYEDIPRRIDAMKYLNTPLSRRIVVSGMALSVLGIAGLIPWKAVTREAIAEGLPVLQKTMTGHYTVRLAHEGSAYGFRIAQGAAPGQTSRIRIKGRYQWLGFRHGRAEREWRSDQEREAGPDSPGYPSGDQWRHYGRPGTAGRDRGRSDRGR